MIDWLALDRQLQRAVHQWRSGCSQLDVESSDATTTESSTKVMAAAPNPIGPDLVGERRRAQLTDLDDPLATIFLPWLEALAAERVSWPDRVALAREWRQRHRLPQLEALVSCRDLRRTLLTHPKPNGRQQAALAFASRATAVSDRSIAALEQRLERDVLLAPSCQHLTVADLPAETAERLARELLACTDDAATELSARSWFEGLASTLATDADRGWPARLTVRWLQEIFASSGLTEGLMLRLAPLPPARGAMSFARALGQLGVAMLDAGRDRGLFLALHQHLMGTRRHQRRALFASLAAQPSFARKVLGLGHERARNHHRALTRAMLRSLRIDALRVLACAALRQGKQYAQEHFELLAATVLGPAAPRCLLGTIPRLRPADGASLVGELLAIGQQQQLVERFDEDWFLNPGAVTTLRHLDTQPREAQRAAPDQTVEELRRCLTLLTRRLGHSLC